MQLDTKYDWIRQESRKTRFSTVTLPQYEEYFTYLKSFKKELSIEGQRIKRIIDGRLNRLKNK